MRFDPEGTDLVICPLPILLGCVIGIDEISGFFGAHGTRCLDEVSGESDLLINVVLQLLVIIATYRDDLPEPAVFRYALIASISILRLHYLYSLFGLRFGSFTALVHSLYLTCSSRLVLSRKVAHTRLMILSHNLVSLQTAQTAGDLLP